MSTNETRFQEWCIQLMIKDGYDQCWQPQLPLKWSHERKLYHTEEFRQWPTLKYTSYQHATGWLVGCCMSSEVEIRSNWAQRVGSGANGSSDFRNPGLEESHQLGVPWFCFFASLLISIFYYIFESRPGTNGVSIGFYHLLMEGDFQRAPDPPNRLMYGPN